MERVQRELQRQLSSLILIELKDPRLSFPFAITQTVISADLRVCKVYVSIDAPGPDQQTVMQVLDKAKGRLRRLLGEGLELRVVPELRFFLDDTAEKAHRIDEILNNLNKS